MADVTWALFMCWRAPVNNQSYQPTASYMLRMACLDPVWWEAYILIGDSFFFLTPSNITTQTVRSYIAGLHAATW